MEGPDERAESQQRSREGCRRHPSFLRRSLRCEGLTRGWVSGEKHTCVSHLRWPRKGTEPQLPARQSALQHGYSYGCRQPENQEVAQKRGPTPTAGHTLRGHPQLFFCPGRGRMLFQPWSSDPPSLHRRPAVSRARTERATASLLHPPGPGWQTTGFSVSPAVQIRFCHYYLFNLCSLS